MEQLFTFWEVQLKEKMSENVAWSHLLHSLDGQLYHSKVLLPDWGVVADHWKAHQQLIAENETT